MGNQAFHLSQLLQRGYPVVPGFVIPARLANSSVTADAGLMRSRSRKEFSNSTAVSTVQPLDTDIAFWEFIKILGESDPLLADLPQSSFHVDVDNPHQLQQVAQQIRHEITAAALPSVWASSLLAAADVLPESLAMILRPSLSLSSLTQTLPSYKFDPRPSLFNSQEHPHSFGILDSHICPRAPEEMAFSLKRVWAELFRARSLFYWQRVGIGLEELNLAVLVQPIWDAIASGILTANSNEWNIQATWGLGIAIAKGEVLPDSYQLQAQTGTIKTRSLGRKTRAYRLSNLSRSVQSAIEEPQKFRNQPESPLQAYLLSEEQQKQYALEEKYLNQLIQLSQRIAAEIGSTFSLAWTLYQTPRSSEPQIYVTQFMPQISPSAPLTPPSLTSKALRGLPVAAGVVIAPAQVMLGGSRNLEAMLPGRILVAPSIAPDWLPLLKQAVGIVTEQGGMTCHAAIMARELGIPAVVNAVGVTQLIQTGESLILDGDRGEVHRLGNQRLGEQQSKRMEEPSTPLWHPPTHQAETPRIPQSSPYPIATQLLVNLSQVSSLEKTVGLPVDGVGLLRSELMMLEALENLHPNEWLQQGLENELIERLAYSMLKIAAAFTPRPVLYRSLDWRSHEFQSLGGTPPTELEVNPMLGRRGTLRYLSDPSYFNLELKALEQVQSYGYTNVRLMLPFVRTVEEFTFCRRRVEQIGLTDNPQFQLWIMAEVPSVLFLLPDYVKAGVQGISIGTNDLTQLLLAVDRDQGSLGSGLDGRHPAVLRAVKQLIETAKTSGIPCSICGQAPVQYPELIDLLVQWGITSISVDINDVERTHNAIARAEQRLLLEAARQKLNS